MNLHDTHSKEQRGQNLLSPRHLQLPDRYNGKNQDHNIGEDIHYACGVVRSVDIDAVAPLHKGIPEFFARNADGNFDDSISQVEGKDTPAQDLDNHVEWHISFGIWNEYP